jgi:hypothetical protein
MLIIEKIFSITLFNVILNFDKPLAYVKFFHFLAKNEWQMIHAGVSTLMLYIYPAPTALQNSSL